MHERIDAIDVQPAARAGLAVPEARGDAGLPYLGAGVLRKRRRARRQQKAPRRPKPPPCRQNSAQTHAPPPRDRRTGIPRGGGRLQQNGWVRANRPSVRAGALLAAPGQHRVEGAPDAVAALPGSAGGGLGVFGGAGLEEVGVLDAAEQALQPGQRFSFTP